MKDEAFYRYIYRQGDGYCIKKNNEYYGEYDKLEEALFDRDRLIQTNWDVSLWLELPDMPNPYYHIELPPFNHDMTGITRVSKPYRVQKRINGKVKYFGAYATYDEAKQRRDELISNNWECGT